eukprot:15439359-Alexandrium_andersonii.AAC.1
MLNSLAAIRPLTGDMGPTGFALNPEAYGEGVGAAAPGRRALRGETLAKPHVPQNWRFRFRMADAGTRMADAHALRELRKEIWRQTEE